jgi:pimeloyl-ACP methyl ester carboxylesterase
MKKSITIIAGLVVIMFILGCASSRYYHLGTKEFHQIDYGFPLERVKIRNIEIGYIDQGSSDQVLLLIHGLGSNAKGWSKNIPVWAEKYRVLAVDLPGYGISDKGYYPYSMSFYAQVLTEFLDELDISKATFVGHSMGGQIAIIAALKYPDSVDKLVLISTAGFEKFTEGEGAWMKGVMTPELVRDTPIRNIDINLRANFYETPPDAEFMITDRIQVRGAKDFELYCYAVSRNVDGMLNEPVWDKLDKVDHPTLIIFGENDGLIPNPYLHGGKTEKIAGIGVEGIPNNRLVMMSKCGHFVQFEKWEETNRVIIEFLEGSL